MSRSKTADCVRAGIIIWCTCHSVNATLSRYNSKPDLPQPGGQSMSAAVSQPAPACEAWLPDLMKIKAWKSSASKCQTDITVVTQLSFDRLDMLVRLCTTWHGWVSAAVYLPLDPQSYGAHLHAAVTQLDQLHADLESGQCKLDMMLYVPQGPPPPTHPAMHPLNALRNRAIAAAQTEVLFLLDVDFMVSSCLNELQHSGWVHSVVSQGVLVVIPAFEPVSNDLTSQQAVTRSCTGGKAEALAEIGQGLLQPFHVNRFEAGHSATDFPRWLVADDLYTAQYAVGFEPYVLVSKALVPWYDERFTGYLEDKVVHIQHMVHMGFSFAVHPEVFVVHYPHEDSKDQGLVKATGLMQQIQAMGDAARHEMAAGVYLPPTKFAPCSAPYQTPAHTGFVRDCTDAPGFKQTGDHAVSHRRRIAADVLSDTSPDAHAI
ncbi:TPA: hypothetical protein ACH3X2_003151 [Trebouxia sp. C0005]